MFRGRLRYRWEGGGSWGGGGWGGGQEVIRGLLAESACIPKRDLCRLAAASSAYTLLCVVFRLPGSNRQHRLKRIYQSRRKSFLIVSDSRSALEAISTRKITHPFLVDIHDLYTKFISESTGVGEECHVLQQCTYGLNTFIELGQKV